MVYENRTVRYENCTVRYENRTVVYKPMDHKIVNNSRLIAESNGYTAMSFRGYTHIQSACITLTWRNIMLFAILKITIHSILEVIAQFLYGLTLIRDGGIFRQVKDTSEKAVILFTHFNTSDVSFIVQCLHISLFSYNCERAYSGHILTWRTASESPASV